MNKRGFGDRGEKLAVDYLKQKDYQVIQTNYLKRSGEIDIVAYDPHLKEYVFVEVKSRRNSYHGYPEEFVDELKIEKIEKTVHIWLEENQLDDVDWRLDIVSVVGDGIDPAIHHLENV